MTIAEIQKQPIFGKTIFCLKSASGIEFLTQYDDIKHPGNTVDLTTCTVVGEAMDQAEAEAWARAHRLTPAQIEQLKKDLARK